MGEEGGTEKVDAIGAVFGAPVKIVEREVLKHAPHLSGHPVRYGPGERVLVTVLSFPEERPDREGAPSDGDWYKPTHDVRVLSLSW